LRGCWQAHTRLDTPPISPRHHPFSHITLAAERVIGKWIEFYNTERPHSAFDGRTPAEAYAAAVPVDMMDKAAALPTSPQSQQQQKENAFDMKGSLAA